jgi:hypothetical protein
MGLLAHIRAELTAAQAPRCKTCILLERVTDQDRREFRESVGIVHGSVLAKALNALLAELGIDDKVGESSVRAHIRMQHP